MKVENDEFFAWLLIQALGYDIWDRRDEKLYALPLWLVIKKDEYRNRGAKEDV